MDLYTYYAVARISGGPARCCGKGRVGLANAAEMWTPGMMWGSGPNEDYAKMDARNKADLINAKFDGRYQPLWKD